MKKIELSLTLDGNMANTLTGKSINGKFNPRNLDSEVHWDINLTENTLRRGYEIMAEIAENQGYLNRDYEIKLKVGEEK